MRLQFGKKQDVLIARKKDGGLLLKAKYVEVSALRVSGKSLSDYIVMTAKTRKFAQFVFINGDNRIPKFTTCVLANQDLNKFVQNVAPAVPRVTRR